MRNILSLLAIVFLAVACQDPIKPEPEPEPEKAPVFKASFESIESLPSLGWKEDARISVFNKSTINREYKFLGKAGDKSGDFEAVSSTNYSGSALSHIYAVCPYSATTTINSNGELSVRFPETQSGTPEQLGSPATTMVAKSDNNSLAFKSITGYLKVRLTGNNVSVKELTLEGNNGEQLSGRAIVSFDANGTIVTTMNNTQATTVKLVCDYPVSIGTKAENYTEFVFAIPSTTFEKGFSLTGKDAQGNIFGTSTSEAITVDGNKTATTKRVLMVDTTPVTFEDPLFKAYVVRKFDKDKDGEISAEEALQVMNIGLGANEGSKDITSLKGIERFSNLKVLTCTYGQLKNIDISRNEKLEHVYLDGNQLTSLDVSNNPLLTILNCQGNCLTSLDVSCCPELENLGCSGNQLTELNVSGHVKLSKLKCNDNNLSKLDVSHCSSLDQLSCIDNRGDMSLFDLSECSSLQGLSCGNSNLKHLDVSDCTALEELNCGNNKLTSLDVSHCPQLAILLCSGNNLVKLDLSSCPGIMKIQCSYNQLTELNVSGCTALTQISCLDNLLTTLDVSDCTALKQLYCNNNKLISLDVSGCTTLEELSCWNNKLTLLNASGCSSLKQILCTSNLLTSLNITGCTSITQIQCSSNNLTTMDLSDCTALKEVYCLYNPISTLYLKAGQIPGETIYIYGLPDDAQIVYL